MEKMYSKRDNDFIDKGLNDVTGAFEEPIILKRYASRVTTPSINGLARSIVYQNISTTAVVEELGIETTSMAHGIYMAGDIKLQMRIKPNEPNEILNNPGDRIVWRGVEYFLVQRAMPIFINNDSFYKVIARRVTSGG